MQEHELWLTALFNDHLAGLANWSLGLFHLTAGNPARPWADWLTMEILVVAILVVGFALLRPFLSVDKPGGFQHIFEVFWDFFKVSTEEGGIEHGAKYVPFFGTLFIFILIMNLIGLIPSLEAPTMDASVTLGLAVATFLYYNFWGFQVHGPKYVMQLMGPVWWLAPLMIPIEIVSHLARPMSLTIRLFANMVAGEQVTGAFMSVAHVAIPTIFMIFHIFISFLQAYIFMLLAIVYVRGAVAHDH
ncbi:MAG: F0F1 ATP synthase subunit A [Bryobacteraceae bacterium]